MVHLNTLIGHFWTVRFLNLFLSVSIPLWYRFLAKRTFWTSSGRHHLVDALPVRVRERERESITDHAVISHWLTCRNDDCNGYGEGRWAAQDYSRRKRSIHVIRLGLFLMSASKISPYRALQTLLNLANHVSDFHGRWRKLCSWISRHWSTPIVAYYRILQPME